MGSLIFGQDEDLRDHDDNVAEFDTQERPLANTEVEISRISFLCLFSSEPGPLFTFIGHMLFLCQGLPDPWIERS